MKQVWIAGLVGAVVGFVWGAFSHMVLPLGEIGVGTIPNEGPVLEAMQASLTKTGFYFFPGEGYNEDMKGPGYAAWVAKLRNGPRGVLVYHPEGSDPMPPQLLLLEFLGNLGGSLIAAWLLLQLPGSYSNRVLAITLLGVFSWLGITASYWIWYGFPADFSLAQLVDGTLQWLIVGLVLAKMVKPRPATA